MDEGAKPAFGSSSGGAQGPQKTFTQIEQMLSEDLVSSVGGVFQFNLKGNV